MTLGFWPHPLFKAGANTELGAHCETSELVMKSKEGEKNKKDRQTYMLKELTDTNNRKKESKETRSEVRGKRTDQVSPITV